MGPHVRPPGRVRVWPCDGHVTCHVRPERGPDAGAHLLSTRDVRWADGRARADQGGRSCTRLLPASTCGALLGAAGRETQPNAGRWGGQPPARAGGRRWLARLHALPSGSPKPNPPQLLCGSESESACQSDHPRAGDAGWARASHDAAVPGRWSRARAPAQSAPCVEVRASDAIRVHGMR